MAQGQDYITPLVSLFAKMNQNKQLNNNYNQLAQQQQQQLGSLNSLYGTDSPYAQTMRQQLDRRDAARGARSQYGPREVELMAKLAGNQSQANQSALNNLYSPGAMQMAQARASSNPLVSNPAAIAMYGKMLGGLPGLFDKAQNAYRSYDTADKYSKFKDAIKAGTAVDDTYDSGLNAMSMGLDGYGDMGSYYGGQDYTGLDVGNLGDWADYSNYADMADAADYSSYADYGSAAADTANYASAASDASDYADYASYVYG